MCTDGIPIYIWLLLWYVIVIIFMNKRFEELALQCGAWQQVYDQKVFMMDNNFDLEKFANLVLADKGYELGTLEGAEEFARKRNYTYE